MQAVNELSAAILDVDALLEVNQPGQRVVADDRVRFRQRGAADRLEIGKFAALRVQQNVVAIAQMEKIKGQIGCSRLEYPNRDETEDCGDSSRDSTLERLRFDGRITKFSDAADDAYLPEIRS